MEKFSDRFLSDVIKLVLDGGKWDRQGTINKALGLFHGLASTGYVTIERGDSIMIQCHFMVKCHLPTTRVVRRKVVFTGDCLYAVGDTLNL